MLHPIPRMEELNLPPGIESQAVEQAGSEGKQIDPAEFSQNNAENEENSHLNHIFGLTEAQGRQLQAQQIGRSHNHGNSEIGSGEECNRKGQQNNRGQVGDFGEYLKFGFMLYTRPFAVVLCFYTYRT